MIMVAPNGARRTKAHHPALPMTAGEIAITARECLDAGAAAIHLHVRDDDGEHCLDAGRYREAIQEIRREVGQHLMIQITTEAVGRYRPDEQTAVVREVRPEAVSVGLAELVPDAAHEDAAAAFYAWAADEGISVQHILYSAEDVVRFRDLVERGVVPVGTAGSPDGRAFVLCVLGRYAADRQSRPADLLPFVQAGLDDVAWSVCAFGRREAACAIMAAALGGHVRVGFENNLHLPDGSVAPDNAALVAAVASGAPATGRALADADTARRISIGQVNLQHPQP